MAVEDQRYSRARQHSPGRNPNHPRRRNRGPLRTFIRRHKRTIWACFIWPALVIFGLLQVAVLVLMVLYTTKFTTDIDPDSPEFALYKNSRFKECASRNPPAGTNCSMLDGDLFPHDPVYAGFAKQGYNFLDRVEYYNEPGKPASGVRYTWCDLASCLNGFQVIPSTPRPSAFRSTGIMRWSSINITGITTILALRTQFLKTPKCPNNCKGISILDWAFMSFSMGTFVFWWYSFGVLMSNPQSAGPISVISFGTPWAYAHSTRFHPLKCVLSEYPRRKKALLYALMIATAIQFAASSYVVYLQQDDMLNRRNIIRRYDCADTSFQDASGVSYCSLQQLCGKDWLFSDAGVRSDMDVPVLGYFLAYMSLTFGLLFPFVYWLIPSTVAMCKRKWERIFDPSELKRAMRDIEPFAALLLLLGLTVFFGVILLIRLGRHWDELNREAGLAYDMECRAVHVPLSQWKQYLDLEAYNRPLRIAKMWFNA